MPRKSNSNRDFKISVEIPKHTPPNAVEIEKSVLGAILNDSRVINRVIELIQRDEVFYSESNRKIFRAIKELILENKPEDIDLLVVSEQLRKNGELEDIGGMEYLLELIKDTVSSEVIENHCKILIEKFMMRELIDHSLKIVSKGYEGSSDVFELLDEAESGIFEISENKFKKTYLSLQEAVNKTEQILAKIKDSGVSGIPTGYSKFNEYSGGFQNSDLIIIAARPGIGKTALALSLAHNIAKYSKTPVGFFSLEMTTSQIVMRLLSAESKIDIKNIRTARIHKSEEADFYKAIRTLAKLPIYIDDTPALSLLELRAKSRRMITEHGVKIIFVDYLQLMQGPSNVESREREISYISRGLKSLAKELDIPIVALAQLNRQVEQRTEKRPLLSDLRESGAIEQDADIVCFIHRHDLYKKQTGDSGKEIVEADSYDKPKVVEIIIAKQRNGPTGSFELLFKPNLARFEDLTKQEVDQYHLSITASKDIEESSPGSGSGEPFDTTIAPF